MEIQRRICTFCMGNCETFKCIERNTKNILELFLPEMDFTMIQGPVMCGNCAETLAKCFEFKTTCLHTYDYLVSFVNNKNSVKLDLNDLFQNKSMTDTGTPEDQDICGFCMGLVKNCNAIPLYIKDEDCKLDKMVQQCLPELDLSVIKEPVICADCHSSLESCFRFVTDCLTAEQRIGQYRENLSSKGQVELSDLLHSSIKTEITNNMESDLFDIVKIEKQICEDGENLEQNEMVSGVNIEGTSCINKNSNNENVNESLMVSDNPKVSNEQRWSPKNVLVWEEKNNKIGIIKIEETLCEQNESKCKDDIFVENDKKCLINAEIEIKTEGQDFNRFEEGVVITKPRVNTRLNEKCLMPNLEEQLSKPPIKQAVMKNKVTGMIYQCKRCSFETNHRSNFEKHLQKHKYSNLTMMNNSSIQTEHKNSLEKHLLVHTNFSEATMYKCGSCKFLKRYRCYLNRHSPKQKDHSEITMYKCETCMNSRKHKQQFGFTMYKCDSCTYQTISENLFERHSRRHKEMTMYKCDSCTYQARFRCHLKRHLLKHKDRSEVKMYKCDSCTYQTIYKGEVKRHSMKHKAPSEVRMYKCYSCEFQTIYKSSIRTHLLKHKDPSELTMYKCDSCAYHTRYRDYFRRHSLKHKHPSELAK